VANKLSDGTIRDGMQIDVRLSHGLCGVKLIGVRWLRRFLN
jgi:hypothetical protein